MVFLPANEADIIANNSKVSADGSINTHNDVQTTGNTINDLLVHDGLQWVNDNVNLGTTTEQTADIIANNAKVSANGTVNVHSDVAVLNPAQGDIMVWDGTNWINIPYTTGLTAQQTADIIANNAKVSADGSVNNHSDVELTPLPSHIVYFDGAQWSSIDEFVLRRRINPEGLNQSFTNQGGLADYNVNSTTNNWIGTGLISMRAALDSLPNGRSPGFTMCAATLDSQLRTHLFLGSGLTLFGIFGTENLYNQVNPFLEKASPTIKELINWNVQVINHFRRICGNPTPIILDNRLSLEAVWEAERRNTLYYGGPPQGHTATNFIPNEEIQALYGMPFSPNVNNNFPLFRIGTSFTGIEDWPPVAGHAGNYASQIFVPTTMKWSRHMENILINWTGYSLMERASPLTLAFFGRERIGMTIFKGPTIWPGNSGTLGTPLSSRLYYCFKFSGPVLNSCLV